MDNLDLVTLFLESSKDRFIKKLNLTDEQKQEVMDFCDKYPQYASKINWQKKDLSYDDIKAVMDLHAQSKSDKKRQAKNDPKTLFKNGNFIIYKETENWLYVLPQSWSDGKFVDSADCGGEPARWCIGFKEPGYWTGYTSGDEPYKTSSFVLAFNKHYDPHIYDGIPKRHPNNDSDALVPDWEDIDYKEKVVDEKKALKYMIQILDNPSKQTSVYGADEVNDKCGHYDHIVWTQDDYPENVIPLCEFTTELSDADIVTIKRIFDKNIRQIDEEAINAMPPITCDASEIESTLADLPKNNKNCPFKLIVSGVLNKCPNIVKPARISFNNCTMSTSTLKALKNDRNVELDMDSLSSANISGLYKDFEGLGIPVNPSKLNLMDYFYAFAEQDELSLANASFENLERARYTFFGAKINHLDLSGSEFMKLKSAERCFDNALIDTLDMTGVQFNDSMDFEGMFTNHKIKTLITDNPKVQQAFDEA